MQEDFKFLVLKSPDDGLLFVSLDSVVGYLRHLSRTLENIESDGYDATGTTTIAKAFSLLSDKLEEIEEEHKNY